MLICSCMESFPLVTRVKKLLAHMICGLLCCFSFNECYEFYKMSISTHRLLLLQKLFPALSTYQTKKKKNWKNKTCKLIQLFCVYITQNFICKSIPSSNTYVFKFGRINSWCTILVNIIQQTSSLIDNTRQIFWRWPKGIASLVDQIGKNRNEKEIHNKKTKPWPIIKKLIYLDYVDPDSK